MKRVFAGRAVAASGLALFILAGPGGSAARAAKPDWPATPYLYTVVNQDLRSVLQRFGENMNARVIMTDGVKGTVQGTPSNTSPINFLDQLCRSYGLDWYYDGTALAFSTVADQQSQTFDLRGVRFADAQRKLTADGVLDPRYVFKAGTVPGTVVVSGPPRYVGAVAAEFGAGTPDQPVTASDSQLVIHEGDKVTVYGGPNFLPK